MRNSKNIPGMNLEIEAAIDYEIGQEECIIEQIPDNQIKLYHIGEQLLTCLINQSCTVQQKLEKSLGLKPKLTARAELLLREKNDRVYFDGEHKVDIVLCSNGEKYFPIELKLGLTNLSKGEFEKNFLGICDMSHQGRIRLKGKMPAILERKFPVKVQNIGLQVFYEGIRYPYPPLTQDWALIVREAVKDLWDAKGKPELSKYNTILVFEEIISWDIDSFKYVLNQIIKQNKIKILEELSHSRSLLGKLS